MRTASGAEVLAASTHFFLQRSRNQPRILRTCAGHRRGFLGRSVQPHPHQAGIAETIQRGFQRVQRLRPGFRAVIGGRPQNRVNFWTGGAQLLLKVIELLGHRPHQIPDRTSSVQTLGARGQGLHLCEAQEAPHVSRHVLRIHRQNESGLGRFEHEHWFARSFRFVRGDHQRPRG